MVSGPLPKDFTALGDTVNIASRLKDVSKAGEIFVGKLTYQFTRRDFNYVKLNPIQLKGKSDPCEVYKLLSEQREIYRTPFGSGRMISSEMVGRETELNLLSMHLLNVINGKGAIVSIIGEAGIGKSRLIAELMMKRVLEIANLKKIEILSEIY